MKIIQIVPSLSYGDAIGNDIIAIDDVLRENGYKTVIYAENIDKRIKNTSVKSIDDWTDPDFDDILLYHMAIGWRYVRLIKRVKCKKVAIYHNVTPAHFYKDYNLLTYNLCLDGLKEVKMLNDTFDFCLADSDFNKEELISFGYKCPIDVLPILIPFDDYKKKPRSEIIDKCKKNKGSNILFVGRIVPNKKIEDIIGSFYYFNNLFDNDSQLYLVGSYDENDLYYRRLLDYIKINKIENVYFSGHIKFDEILAYYKSADLFLCMSEHEGFCVPLIESMIFELPILAYRSTAIPYTLGESGIIIDKKDYYDVASMMNYILGHDEIRKQIVYEQNMRLKDFGHDLVSEKLLEEISKIINL